MTASGSPARSHRAASLALYSLLFVGAILFKVWLVSDQQFSAQGSAQHDDHLFVRSAYSILKGQWLGPYDHLTLIKGPGYPLWIAMSFVLRIPLLVGQHLYYAFACALTILALRPVLRNRFLLFALFILLWFTPSMYCTQLTRALRDSVYTSTVLIVHACLIAIVVWRQRSGRELAAWFAGLGLALGYAYITREESPWLAPCLGLTAIAAFLDLWKGPSDCRRRWILLAPAAPALAALIIGSVASLNYAYYGVFGLTELKADPFVRAFGALTRVKCDTWKPKVIVPSAVRREIYKVSPSFAKLQPLFEGRLGQIWLSHGPGDPDGEIMTVCFMWCLRDAVKDAGYCANARKALDFYNDVANEVNQACDQGLLPCGPYRASLMSPWDWRYIPLWEESFKRATKLLTTYDEITFDPGTSFGSPDEIELMRRMSRCSIARDVTVPTDIVVIPARPSVKPGIMEKIRTFYRSAAPLGAVVSLLSVTCAAVLTVYRRRLSKLSVLCGVLVASVMSRLLLLSYIDASAFPSLNVMYMAPAYPLFLLVCVLAPFACVSEFRNTPLRESLNPEGGPVAEATDRNNDAARTA